MSGHKNHKRGQYLIFWHKRAGREIFRPSFMRDTLGISWEEAVGPCLYRAWPNRRFPSGLLDSLSMEIEVEALDLRFLIDTQADKAVDDFEDDEGCDRAPQDGGNDTFELN